MNSKHSITALALAAVLFSAAGTATASADEQLRVINASESTEVTAFRHIDVLPAFKLPGAPLQLSAADEASAQAVIAAQMARADQYALAQLARTRPVVTPEWRLVSSV